MRVLCLCLCVDLGLCFPGVGLGVKLGCFYHL